MGVKWWKFKICYYYWDTGEGGRCLAQNGENILKTLADLKGPLNKGPNSYIPFLATMANSAESELNRVPEMSE